MMLAVASAWDAPDASPNALVLVHPARPTEAAHPPWPPGAGFSRLRLAAIV